MRTLILLILLMECVLGFSQKDTRQFIFGHSLIDHRPPINPTPSDETTVPHWLFLLSQEAGHGYAATGQYGFLQQHMNLPPFAQWGYDIVPPAWDSDTEAFSDANFNNVLITAANFAQWQGPSEPFYNDPNNSPISATRTITDWLQTQEDSIAIYIYENWPDMAPYLSSFPPNATEMNNYHNYTLGAFHDWWIEYHDSLLLQRPDQQIKMIPVGPILSGLMLDTEVANILITELYEDDAPHGRPSLYFMASLITYMAIYQEKAPASFNVPSIVDPIIADNYLIIVDYIWDKLLDFDTEQGKSRVFFGPILSETQVSLDTNHILIYPNPSEGIFRIKGATSFYTIDILDSVGQVFQTVSNQSDVVIDISSLPAGLFFIRIQNINHQQILFQKILKL